MMDKVLYDKRQQVTKHRRNLVDKIRSDIYTATDGFTIEDLKTFLTEIEIVDVCLKHKPLTAKALSAAVDLPIEAICRYKRTLEKEGKLWRVKKVDCPFTGHPAWTLTTDPKKAPSLEPKPGDSFQLELFGNGN
jgi:hypothetical protein